MDIPLLNHVPQAVSEMFTCATKLGKKFVRGVLTNGHNWIFLVLRVKDDGTGAEYAESEAICLMGAGRQGTLVVSPDVCSLLAGIIAHWASRFGYLYLPLLTFIHGSTGNP